MPVNHKKVLAIATSPRAGGSSSALAGAFAQGAREAGHDVETVGLHDKEIGFCRGCLACQETHRCVIRDDGEAVARKMAAADVLAFATPIYYYGMSGQMKTMLDRANPLYGGGYAFREVYLLAAAADPAPAAAEGAVRGLEGWVSCFGEARLAGVVFGGGAGPVGALQGSPALEEARAMGRAVGRGCTP